MHTALVITAWTFAVAGILGVAWPFAAPAVVPTCRTKNRATSSAATSVVGMLLATSACLTFALNGPKVLAVLLLAVTVGHLIVAALARVGDPDTIPEADQVALPPPWRETQHPRWIDHRW